MSSDTPPLDADGCAEMKRGLDDWLRVGPILEHERWDRVAALTDAEATDADFSVLGPYGDEAPVVDVLLDHFHGATAAAATPPAGRVRRTEPPGGHRTRR